MSEVVLEVGGRRHAGWKSIRITRSLETLAGSFHLDVSDRWAAEMEPRVIREEDPCRVKVGGDVVIDGFIDERTPVIDGHSRSLTYTGRDRASLLVDCSAILDRWSFRNATVADIARKLTEPFGIKVAVAEGLELERVKKFVVSPGETAWQALERAAHASGVLAVSDGAGGILLTRAGTERIDTHLIEGEGLLLAGRARHSARRRHRRYIIATQAPGTDRAHGNATRLRAEAEDLGVRREDRVLMLLPGPGITAESAKRRADWEARIRAARAESISAVVRGWRRPGGELWDVNRLVYVRSRTLDVDGDRLISEASPSLGDRGEVTELRLVRPDAFTPDPAAVVR